MGPVEFAIAVREQTPQIGCAQMRMFPGNLRPVKPVQVLFRDQNRAQENPCIAPFPESA